jgi:Protein of unknown function (DUF1822)
MPHIEESLKFTITLASDASEIARAATKGISNLIKAQQIYRNTLAIYAVDYYLRCLGFVTDWQHSDSHNPVLMRLMNVADLQVEHVGRLECIPVMPDWEECDIPPESERERVGYIPVELNQTLTEATILGLSKQKHGRISLDRLLNIEELVEYLTNLEQPTIVKLGQWLDSKIDTGWETLDRLLSPAQLRLCRSISDRQTVIRGHSIFDNNDRETSPLNLVVQVNAIADSAAVDILIQVYPVDRQELPNGVKLTVTDDSAQTAIVTSQAGDNWIQLDFTANLGEEFKLVVSLNDTETIERFII